MINPGTNLCRKCGKTSHIHYYHSGKERQGAKLVWKPEQKVFALEPYSEEGTGAPVKITLKNPEKHSKAALPPDTVTAFFYNSSNTSANASVEPVIMQRSCPHCKEHSPLPPDMGKIPCYVIAVIGAVSSGKTSWLGALPNALSALSEQNFPYRIEPWKLGADSQMVKSTIGDEEGNTNYFLIIDQETDERIAMLYLLDSAGELLKGENINPEEPLGRILLGNDSDDYKGLDGVVVIEPAVADDLNKNRTGTDEVIEVISKIRETLNRVPVARICSFADKLIIAETEKNRKDPAYIPRVTEKTFPRTAYSDESNRALSRHYTPEAIVRRIQLQDYIARDITNGCVIKDKIDQVMGRNNKNVRNNYYHFLVQSCVMDKTVQKNNYRIQFNVADPLIWLLYKLQLFPLTLTGG